MRVAVVHSFYRESAPSGENQVVRDQVELLRQAGHEVCLISRHSDIEMRKPLYGLRSSVRVATGWGDDPIQELEAFDPDLVHIHNLFPNFGTSWLERWRGPIVATMHNFRTLCSNGFLYRNGDTCFECRFGNPWPGIKHGCYRDSVVATIPVAMSISRTGHMNTLLKRADTVICLSKVSADIFASTGISSQRLTVIPNPLQDPKQDLRSDGQRWLYSGRLSEEKGVAQLVRNWPEEAEPLDVVGQGPLLSEIETFRPFNVHVLGPLDRNELLGRMPHYRGLVVPSRWIEVQPTVVTEALACGLPVIAYAGNSAAALVTGLNVGTVYDSNTRLSWALTEAIAGGTQLRRHCRETYEKVFSAEKWQLAIRQTYGRLL